MAKQLSIFASFARKRTALAADMTISSDSSLSATDPPNNSLPQSATDCEPPQSASATDPPNNSSDEPPQSAIDLTNTPPPETPNSATEHDAETSPTVTDQPKSPSRSSETPQSAPSTPKKLRLGREYEITRTRGF